MPTWKKVIVSGSNAQLATVTASAALQVGTNQYITTSPATTYLSGSFSGSFFGNGSGLTNVTATAIFPTTAKTDLATTDQIYINDGTNKYITYGNLVTDLAGSGAGTSNLTTTDTGDSLALTSQISVTGVTASLSGNATTATTATNATNTAITDTTTGTGPYYITFVGSNSGNQPQLVDSNGLTYNATTNGVTATSFTGSLSGTATAVPWTGITGTPSGIVSASSLASSTQGQVTLTTNGVGVTTNLNSLQAADSPTFANVNANAASFGLATSTATAIQIGGSGATVTIPGNLTINGTTTIVNTTNTAVKDQFILLNSGSTGTTDGGIIVGNSATINIGEAFYWENNPSGTGRWAIASAIDASSAGPITANSYVVTVSGSNFSGAQPTANPTYGGGTNGIGNMFIDTSLTGTSDNNIWIFA